MRKTKIKVVLDTSVLISALKSKNPKRSPAWRILNALARKEIENYVSQEVLQEMKEVLDSVGEKIRKRRTAELIWLIVTTNSKPVKPRRKFSGDKAFVRKLGDVSDAKFFDVAYAKKVEYIITEDMKHILKLRDKNKEFKFDGRSVRILTPREFMREVLK